MSEDETPAEGTGQSESEPASQADNVTDFTIPEEYQDKGWAKNISSLDDLYKSHDNAQTLIGKKTIGIPEDWENEEQVNDFYNKIRPENKDDYVFPEGTFEYEKYADLFHEVGLSKHQADKLTASHLAMQEAFMAEVTSEKGFKEGMTKLFGEDFKKEAGEAALLLKNSVSAESYEIIDNTMPNQHLNIFYEFAKNIKASHGIKESDANLNNAGTMGKVDKEAGAEAVRKEMFAMQKRPHTAEEMQTLQNKLNNYYK